MNKTGHHNVHSFEGDYNGRI